MIDAPCAPSQPSRVGGHIDAINKNNARLAGIIESLNITRIRLLGNVQEKGGNAVSACPPPSGTLSELQTKVILQSQAIDVIEELATMLSEV